MDQLYDGSATVVAVSAVLISISILSVGLRMWIRWSTATQGMDDYLLLAGLVLWIVSTSMVFPAAWNGVGAHAGRYTTEQSVLAQKYFFIFQDFYVWANVPIKSSICLTMIRLSGDRTWITWTLYSVMFVIFGSSVGTNIYLLTGCTPLAATWDKSMEEFTCRPAEKTVVLGNAYSGINIAVDWLVALLPVFLLWKVQLALKLKLVVMGALSLGIFASTATLIRIRTLTAFAQPDDYLFGLGPIVIWTVVELGLALIAASFVSFRPLVRRWFGSTQRTTDAVEDPFRSTGQRKSVFRGAAISGRTNNHSDIGLETMVNSNMGLYGRLEEGDNGSEASIIRHGGSPGDIQVTRTISMKREY